MGREDGVVDDGVDDDVDDVVDGVVDDDGDDGVDDDMDDVVDVVDGVVDVFSTCIDGDLRCILRFRPLPTPSMESLETRVGALECINTEGQ